MDKINMPWFLRFSYKRDDKDQEVKMNHVNRYIGWAWIVLALLFLGRVGAVFAQQPGAGPGWNLSCQRLARVDPWDYYPISGDGTPSAGQVEWEVVCVTDAESSGLQLANALVAHWLCSAMDARVYPLKSFPIQDGETSSGQMVVWREVCEKEVP
jgi:hypothetical protein